jgi:hypothetical protein
MYSILKYTQFNFLLKLWEGLGQLKKSLSAARKKCKSPAMANSLE